MRQLSGLDDAFLSLEGPTQALHVTSLIVLDGASLPDGWGYRRVLESVGERIGGLLPYRARLQTVPLGLDHPYWRVGEDVDLEFHVRHSAVPSPGDDRALSEVVARLHARPLDRSRPLWEMYVIEGLRGGDVALLTKIHHAAIDGMAGMELASVMLDRDPDGRSARVPDALEPDAEPSAPMMLARSLRGLARVPLRAARTAVNGLGELPAIGSYVAMALPDRVRSAVPRGDGGLIDGGPTLQAPPTPFNAPLTPHRRVAWSTLSLDTVRAVRRARGTTVNDVVMAVTAGALRRELLDRDALPDRPLQAMVPISVRGEGDADGNRVTAMVGLLPTHLADPLARLDWTAAQMARAKEHDAVPASVLQDATAVMPPSIAARAVRVATRLRWADAVRLPYNVVVSNVPGPREPLYVAGARMKHMIPVSAIADGVGLNVTVISHEDDVDVGLVADREMVDDLWVTVGRFDTELRALAAALDVPAGDGSAGVG